ncbi:MAG: pyridoxamine 5'-phosphate oxidase family protein [Micromonosporaceae bacterium]
MRWDEFVKAASELGERASERLRSDQVVLLGTLLPDGAPRISGVECDLVDGELMIGMIWRSMKALDLRRDPRFVLHTLVPDKAREADSQGDIKLYGSAAEVTDPARKRRYEDTIRARIDWAPAEPYHCFAFDIERAGMVRFADDKRQVWSWRAGGAPRRRAIPELGPE